MKYKIVLSLFLVIAISHPLHAEFPKKTKDSLGYDALRAKIRSLKKEQKIDSAYWYAKRLLYAAKKTGRFKKVGKAYRYLGFYAYELQKIDSAFYYHTKAYENYLQTKSSIAIVNTLISMANNQNILGDYTGSKITAIEALRYLKKNQKPHKHATLHHLIAVALKENGQAKEALEWNRKIFEEILPQIPSKEVQRRDLLKYQNTKANILANLQQYGASIAVLEAILQDSLTRQKSEMKARYTTNLGRVKWLENKHNTESEALFLEGFRLRKALNRQTDLISSSVHLANYYQKTQPNSALQYANLALDYAQKLQNPRSILEALEVLIPLKIAAKQNIAPLAILQQEIQKKRYLLFQKNRDIYASTRFNNQKLRAEKTQKDLELARQEVALQRQEKRNFTLVGLVICLLILGLGLYLYFYKKNQLIRVKERHRTQRVLSKTLHDEVGSSLFLSVHQLQSLKQDKLLPIIDSLDKVYEKIRSFSREQYVETGSAYAEEIKDLLHAYSDDTVQIILSETEDGFWENIPSTIKEELYFIIKELMTNMHKHSTASLVSVQFSKTSKKLHIQIVDNGIGVDWKQSSKKNGLMHVENRTKDLKGKCIFESQPQQGFKTKISIPI
ncbi:MAG: hypothetical protein OIF50_15420 [Flavobacteriaceae bacterium]|nr:hypothetical protein [Flavobacteriaceae bacterium]